MDTIKLFTLVAITLFAMMQFTWLHYLAVMRLKEVRDAGRLNKWARMFGMPLLFIGYFSDFISNMIPLTILMFELPKELLVSARVARHQKENRDWESRRGISKYIAKWRYSVAHWACTNLLDPFDPSGCHCKE